MLGFYTARMKKEGVSDGQSGAVVVVQRTSSDLKLAPHLHVLLLDGVYRELDASTVGFTALPHLSTREVGEVLETICTRVDKLVRRRGLLDDGALEPQAEADEPLSSLAVSAVSGQSPPAGPEWRRRMLPPLAPQALHFDKPLCASKDGFTLHAATHAGALDLVGREALCKYVLRPAIAQERVTHGPDGLVRIALKRPFADGTVAVKRRDRRAPPDGGQRQDPDLGMARRVEGRRGSARCSTRSSRPRRIPCGGPIFWSSASRASTASGANSRPCS